MTILKALQSDDLQLRISYGDRWLYCECDNGEVMFCINEHKRHAKKVKTIFKTEDEEEAVQKLIEK